MAQAHRALGELERALHLYEEYLRDDPMGQYATAAHMLVPELREQLRHKAATTVAPPTTAPASSEMPAPPSPSASSPAPVPTQQATPNPATEPPRPAPSVVPVRNGRAQRTAGLALGGAGVALIALGGAFVGLAKSANDAITSSGTFDASAQDRRNAFQSADIACFVIGGTAVAGGLTLYLIARSGKR
jgi:uncharacterized membrane protein